MVDLLVLAADHAEARKFAEAGTSQPQNGLIARPLHDKSSDHADVTGRPEPPPVLATTGMGDAITAPG